ncbi:CocE/NonD family hydrolase [Dyadobacter bucti]|uniref:CocE/NonD family hydrolase n=1 Tax=Dyadobacter bucti TaxID=2572203 RepID=UPI003F728981
MRTHLIAGTDPGQRQLNGPQTSGRQYRNLSKPDHEMACDEDVTVPMRDGINLLADVHRPAGKGRFPVLIAASPYPRQVQNLGAPAGFIEAGASDFFVPRGYVHLIVNLRGTGGSGGTFGFFDAQERQDMFDLVEWAAEQPWSNGNIGMVGISYFAMTQIEAAVERPPHLKAIMPVACTFDLYEAAYHHGLFSSSFITPFLSMIGLTSSQTNKLWRSKLVGALRGLLRTPFIHKQFATMNGEAAIAGLKFLLKVHHDPHPWDDLWRAIAVEHPLRDDWWDQRNLLPLLDKVEIPVYLGCDWQNVPLHLPGTFPAFQTLVNSKHVQVAILGEYGLSWPWESLHLEALAWFDHWLKGTDTGILEGPSFRYVLPGAEGWHAANTWPIPETNYQSLYLKGDGTLGEADELTESRSLLTLGAGLNRPVASQTDPLSNLSWDSQPLENDLDMVGNIELQLDAICTATDTAWIVLLQDVDPDGIATDITAGYLRAGLREVDETASSTGAPFLPCRSFSPIPLNEQVRYRIPIVPNARRFKAGHRVRLLLTSDDQSTEIPVMIGFRHGSMGTSCLGKIVSSSKLLLPFLPS